VRVVGLLPAVSLALGVAVGLVAPWPRAFVSALALAALVAAAGWLRRWPRVTTVALVIGFASGGAAIATQAADAALHPPLRQLLQGASAALRSTRSGRQAATTRCRRGP